MNLPDSFYIALCMTVLLVGAVYWVWTQIQYVQRKVNVLENIVYELKTLCSKPPPDVLIGAVGSSSTPSPYPPAPSSVLGEDEDLLHEQLHREVEETPITDVDDLPEMPNMDTFMMSTDNEVNEVDMVEAPVHEEDVKEINTSDISNFVRMVESEQQEDGLQPGGVGSGIVTTSLDSMHIKELRRLAQSRGISNANELRKKDLVAAIRALPTTSFD